MSITGAIFALITSIFYFGLAFCTQKWVGKSLESPPMAGSRWETLFGVTLASVSAIGYFLLIILGGAGIGIVWVASIRALGVHL